MFGSGNFMNRYLKPLCVSNSLSGGDGEMNKVHAVGDPMHMA
jgi:hypothetical protein